MLTRVTDAFQTYLRELRPSDLEGSAGLYRLKEELTRRVNAAIEPARINAVLFKDRLELPFNRGVANLHRKGGPLVSIIVPFIKTPLRILERTALDYTPLGMVTERFRTAIKAGGSQRDEAAGTECGG